MNKHLKDFTSSLGYLNCNPCNIRFSPLNNWKGQIGTRMGFVVFDSFENGFRAAMKLIHNYTKCNYDTIEDIISRWAPPSENNTTNYINYVVRRFNDGSCTATSFTLPISKNTPIPSSKEDYTAHASFIAYLVSYMTEIELGIKPSDRIALNDDYVELINFLKRSLKSNCKYIFK